DKPRNLEHKVTEPKEKENENVERPWWSEMMKELTLSGLATVFMTEESVRNYLKEKRLPKELASLVLASIGKKKDDFYALLAGEFGKVLSKIDVTKEVGKFLESHRMHLETKISFEPRKPKDV